MLRQIINRIIRIQKAVGIEVNFQGEHGYSIVLVTAFIKQGKVIKEGSITFSDYKKLPDFLKKEIPLFLLINGKGVLTKMVARDTEMKTSLETILPGVNPKDFYSTLWLAGDNAIASVIRKKQADDIVHQISQLGYKVLWVSYGFSPIDALIEFIDVIETPEVETSAFLIQYNQNKHVKSFRAKPDSSLSAQHNPEYLVANQYVRANELLAFAGATVLLADDIAISKLHEISLITTNREDYKYQKLYTSALWGLLSSVLIILLSNFFFFNHYFDKNKQLNASKTMSEKQITISNTLKEDLDYKEHFLQQAGWVRPTRMSLIADRIASLVPTSTFLTSLSIHPTAMTNYSDDSHLQFRKDTVLIIGQCDNPSEINQFVNNLKNIDFIKSIVVKNYFYKKEIGTFTMEIIVNK